MIKFKMSIFFSYFLKDKLFFSGFIVTHFIYSVFTVIFSSVFQGKRMSDCKKNMYFTIPTKNYLGTRKTQGPSQRFKVPITAVQSIKHRQTKA
ncbi:hypothetical protein IX83_04970 [Basilea psittacipulmonis DSM 24701]|uniref:Uncharacterized protein n=1 Tax=Basilea psittacipulmonis DSM 24701 TaxID=1072685 RepID=A0A077DDR6_9BURK|nr:hypothetical protein IX83_04970 [Basilea psittacipulmonis DSM 24701]